MEKTVVGNANSTYYPNCENIQDMDVFIYKYSKRRINIIGNKKYKLAK
jgi:hypothetical protein